MYEFFFSKRKKRNFHSSKRDQKLHSIIHSVSEFPSPISIGTIDKTHKSAIKMQNLNNTVIHKYSILSHQADHTVCHKRYSIIEQIHIILPLF